MRFEHRIGCFAGFKQDKFPEAVGGNRVPERTKINFRVNRNPKDGMVFHIFPMRYVVDTAKGISGGKILLRLAGICDRKWIIFRCQISFEKNRRNYDRS